MSGHSIHSWVLMSMGLMILGVIGLAAFTVVADGQLQALDARALHEQDLIDEVKTQATQVYEMVDRIIIEPSESLYNGLQAARSLIAARLAELRNLPQTPTGRRIITDFCEMVTSYLEEAETSVLYRQAGLLDSAEQSHNEVIKIYGFINGEMANLFMVLTEDSNILRQQADRVREQNIRIIVVLGAAVILFAVYFAFQVVRRIVTPLDALTRTAERVNLGTMDVRVSTVSRDLEIQRLAEAFTAMLTTIDRQVSALKETNQLRIELHRKEMDNQRSRTLLKEAQLQALQSRINPHFQFNTLNMICQSAYAQNVPQIAEMLEALAAMLHYVMADSTKAVMLGEEVQHTSDYFYIQKLRFGPRIAFELNCPPAYETVPVPRLVIQPLVENAINHGVKSSLRDARITVEVAKRDEGFLIRVADNGDGIPEADLAALRSRITADEDAGTSMGLRNVYQRVKLFFGETADLTVASEWGKGTCVELRFPDLQEVY